VRELHFAIRKKHWTGDIDVQRGSCPFGPWRFTSCQPVSTRIPAMNLPRLRYPAGRSMAPIDRHVLCSFAPVITRFAARQNVNAEGIGGTGGTRTATPGARTCALGLSCMLINIQPIWHAYQRSRISVGIPERRRLDLQQSTRAGLAEHVGGRCEQAKWERGSIDHEGTDLPVSLTFAGNDSFSPRRQYARLWGMATGRSSVRGNSRLSARASGRSSGRPNLME
jgi:hypothetical protein